MSTYHRQKGSTFERLIADHLAAALNDEGIDRQIKTGGNCMGTAGDSWDNRNSPGGAGNTNRGLTRTSGTSREGLPVMVPKTCNHCGDALPEPRSGRGGKQPSRKFCSPACQTAHGNALRRDPAPVKCMKCGKQRLLLNPSLAGEKCSKCSSKLGSERAAKINTQKPIDRFMRKITLNSTTGCWEWQGTTQKNGYSAFAVGGRLLRGHRWSYEYFVGQIPNGLQIDHLCRNRCCVNPAHLEPVTALENARRAMRTHCVNGHEFTPENVYIPKDGKRYCRTCRRAHVRAYQARVRA